MFPNGTVSGAVQAVVPDPVDPNTLYIGTPNGGIWVTHNAGATWTPLTDKLASLSISSMSLDPTDPTYKTLVAGTGLTSNGSIGFDAFTGSGGAQIGLLSSKDGGNSWSTLGGATFAGQTVASVAERGSVFLAGTYELSGFASQAQKTAGGLYRSSDGGTSFTLVSGAAGSGLPAGPVSSIVGDPANSAKFYAAVATPVLNNAGRISTAVYVSNDTGQTWTQVFNSTESAGTINTSTHTAIRLAAGPGNTVAAGVIDLNSGVVTGIFWSNNSGASWTSLPVPSLNNGNQASPNFAIAIDPNNPKFVYVSGDRINGSPFTAEVYRINAIALTTPVTLDRAGTADGSTPHADTRAIAFDASGRLILSSDGGVYARTLPQTSAGVWQGLNGNLSVFASYGIAYDANNKRLALAAQDNGVTIQATPGQTAFNALAGADGVNVSINDRTVAGTSVLYESYFNLGGLSRHVLDANGNTVSPKNNTWGSGTTITCNGGNDCGDGTQVVGVWFSSPFVLNRIDPSRIAIGGGHVYVTQDTQLTSPGLQASNIDLTLTDLGATHGSVYQIAYGTRDNINAIVASSGGGLWGSFTPTPGADGRARWLSRCRSDIGGVRSRGARTASIRPTTRPRCSAPRTRERPSPI